MVGLSFPGRAGSRDKMEDGPLAGVRRAADAAGRFCQEAVGNVQKMGQNIKFPHGRPAQQRDPGLMSISQSHSGSPKHAHTAYTPNVMMDLASVSFFLDTKFPSLSTVHPSQISVTPSYCGD